MGRQARPPKASTAHSGTTGVIFCSGKVVWGMGLGGDSILGVETEAWPSFGKFTLTYIANVRHIFDILSFSVDILFR